MPFKLLITRFWSNTIIILKYCYTSGEGNECGHRVRQIWRRGPRQYWLRGWRMSLRHSQGRERSHVFSLLLHARETKQQFGVRYERNASFQRSLLSLNKECTVWSERFMYDMWTLQENSKVKCHLTGDSFTSEQTGLSQEWLRRYKYFFIYFALGC